MITLREIKSIVVGIIEAAFPEGRVLTKNVNEELDIPSFFIEFDNIRKNSRLFNYERDMTIRIYIYPSINDEGGFQLLDIIEKLEDNFDLKFMVQDRYLKITETLTKKEEGIFQFEFHVNYFETKEMEESNELMQELNFK
ncbi:phage tail terminator family protein [Alkaliphilus peptidifermentans]|uniref:Phage protein n=1 Tax=Alkaliphilus peptidifermentans DSM 18978 TaxID=1120976 RepID=A0A1G5JYX5_9FIRM|nr:hypothetical protein [Alkaliphilus peptidifermentans]SCY93070.1 hypothetical protein SAMN03080606_03102 [Alkaliphilus peptidifermentans DSM 18978]